MNISYMFTSAAVLLAAVSCTGEMFQSQPCEGSNAITVALDADSRTLLAPADAGGVRKLFWCEGDCINVNGNVSEPLSGVEQGSTKATFNFASAQSYPYRIFYPASMLSGSTVTLPAMQSYAEGSFASGCAPAAGYSAAASSTAVLRNVAAVVKVSIRKGAGDASIKRIYFTGRGGEQVSGAFTVDFQAGSLSPAAGDAASKVVGMTLPSLAVPATDSLSVHLVVPAGKYNAGFRVRMIDDSNRSMDVCKGSAVTLAGGQVYALPAVAFNPTATEPDIDAPVFKETFSGGAGTQADPYIIATPADLVALSDAIELYNNDYKLLYYRQTRDIDMSAYDNFKPIGISSTLNFRGKYDGQGHRISNMRLIYSGSSARSTALFGNCGTGTLISNVVMENVTVESNSYNTASIVGYLYHGTVRGCSFTGSVYGTGKNSENVSYLGGVVGRSTAGVIENCTAAGNVTTTVHHAGGVVGEADTGVTIRGCRFARGCSLAGAYYMGGIIGYVKANASNSISDCVCEGSVYSTGTHAAAIVAYILSGSISGCVQSSSSNIMAKLYYAGGIAANACPGSGYSVTIDKCASYGDVTAQYELGGILGHMSPSAADAKVVISNCARVGGVLRATGVNSSNYNLVGGIVGWAQGKGTCRVLNCYSHGIGIDGMSEGVGGFSGIVAVDNSPSGSITNVYTDIVASDISSNGSPVSATSVNYHGAVIGRNMTNPVTVTSGFYDSSYRLGPGSSYSSHVAASCAGYTPAQMTGGTLLSSLGAGLNAAASEAGGTAMLSWKAGSDGYPTLDGIPADTTVPDGKKLRVSIIGDSISTFAGWHPSPYTNHYPNSNNCDVKTVDDTWWYALATKYMKNACIDMNISFSNTTVTQNLFGDSSQYWYGYDFCTRFIQCHGMGKPDVIIIHGGTNDYAHYYGEKLAAGIDMRAAERPSDSIMAGLYAAADACTTLEQAEALEYDTFCESYIKLLKMMRLRYPSVKIICIAGDWLSGGLEQSVLHIAGHYGCRTVDFVQLSGYHNTGAPMTKYSGCHPDRNGMDYMARTIYQMHGAWMEAE